MLVTRTKKTVVTEELQLPAFFKVNGYFATITSDQHIIKVMGPLIHVTENDKLTYPIDLNEVLSGEEITFEEFDHEYCRVMNQINHAYSTILAF